MTWIISFLYAASAIEILYCSIGSSGSLGSIVTVTEELVEVKVTPTIADAFTFSGPVISK